MRHLGSNLDSFFQEVLQASQRAVWRRIDAGAADAYQGKIDEFILTVIRAGSHCDGTASRGSTIIRLPREVALQVFANAEQGSLKLNGCFGGVRHQHSHGVIRRGFIPTIDNTEVSTWFERDRAYVGLQTLGGSPIIELWDEAVSDAVEDGFIVLDKGRAALHRSLVEYANYLKR